MPMMGLREYARHRGCRLYAVQKAINAGRITLVDGKVDSEQADAAWEANTDPLASKRDYAKASAVVGAVEAPVQRNAASQAYLAARAAREEIRREREQIELDKDKGRLVDADDIAQRYSKFVLTTRNQLLGVPAKVKSELPHLTRRDVLAIDRMIREALETLADGGGSAASDSRAIEEQA